MTEFTHRDGPQAEYHPGAFWRRELPLLLKVLKMLPERPSVLVVDGWRIGLAFTRELRRSNLACRQAPVIMVTAHTERSRILEARTRDFRTISEPVVVLDRGRPVIDARVYEISGRRVRFAKEEPGRGSLGVFQEVETEDGWALVASRIGTDRHEHMEGAMLVGDPLRHRWLLWLDQYDRMPQGFVAYASDDPLSGRWTPLDDADFQVPPNTKPGSVLPLDAAEWERVRAAFG